MAQKITGYVKLQIPAGKATPAPPVGPALGQHGVNSRSYSAPASSAPSTNPFAELDDGDGELPF